MAKYLSRLPHILFAATLFQHKSLVAFESRKVPVQRSFERSLSRKNRLLVLSSALVDDDNHSQSEGIGPESASISIDRRPHGQRASGPRKARRLNSRFRYLYTENREDYADVSAMDYLASLYGSPDLVWEMNRAFPPLLELNVSRHLNPKIRFLNETLLSADSKDLSTTLKVIPPHFFGVRLEKTVAPRHAFLVYMGLPNGPDLFETVEGWTKFHEFLIDCRNTKRFCAMCNRWQKRKRRSQQGKMTTIYNDVSGKITTKQIEAFDFLFGRGILAAARDELVQWNNTWALQHINVTSAEILDLLIKHGANPLERDVRGITLLHWACGTGNLEAVRALLRHFPNGPLETTDRDAATPLHWAAAGANSKEFGTGGHVHICQYLLSECDRMRRRRQGINKSEALQLSSAATSEKFPTTKDLVNRLTKDGNSALMWASWSASLDTVKLLIRHRARWDVANRNGCTVAHWAASGGSLDVCRYLHDIVGVDFFVPNHGGNTPLTHAVAFGRVDVVGWLYQMGAKQKQDDSVAQTLAAAFVAWDTQIPDNDKIRRRQIHALFQDDYWDTTAHFDSI